MSQSFVSKVQALLAKASAPESHSLLQLQNQPLVDNLLSQALSFAALRPQPLSAPRCLALYNSVATFIGLPNPQYTGFRGRQWLAALKEGGLPTLYPKDCSSLFCSPDLFLSSGPPKAIFERSAAAMNSSPRMKQTTAGGITKLKDIPFDEDTETMVVETLLPWRQASFIPGGSNASLQRYLDEVHLCLSALAEDSPPLPLSSPSATVKDHGMIGAWRVSTITIGDEAASGAPEQSEDLAEDGEQSKKRQRVEQGRHRGEGSRSEPSQWKIFMWNAPMSAAAPTPAPPMLERPLHGTNVLVFSKEWLQQHRSLLSLPTPHFPLPSSTEEGKEVAPGCPEPPSIDTAPAFPSVSLSHPVTVSSGCLGVFGLHLAMKPADWKYNRCTVEQEGTLLLQDVEMRYPATWTALAVVGKATLVADGLCVRAETSRGRSGGGHCVLLDGRASGVISNSLFDKALGAAIDVRSGSCLHLTRSSIVSHYPCLLSHGQRYPGTVIPCIPPWYRLMLAKPVHEFPEMRSLS